MIRVLHYMDPEQARRRIAFLGADGPEADRLLAGLRAFLFSAPRQNAISRALPEFLKQRGIPHAVGRDVILFSLSSEEDWEAGGERGPDRADLFVPVREALERYRRRRFRVRCRDRVLALDGTPKIMGVLNVTPDSFSDGGKYRSLDRALAHGCAMVEAGADIVDVGGESTRPGSSAIPLEEELERVIPVVRALAERTEAVLSIDTTKAEVARQALSAGAHIVNDTSALRDDPAMAGVVRDAGCAVVLMHRRGTPRTMQLSPSYRSLFDEILDELSDRVDCARAAGIAEDRILVDPGIGFGKRQEDNLALHRHLPDLRNLGKPILFGPSRKAFLGKITGRDPEDRIFGTAASVAAAVLGGAHVLRVHDVDEMRDAVRVAAAVAGGDEC